MICGGIDPGWAKMGLGVVQREGDEWTCLHHQLLITKPEQPNKVRERVLFTGISSAARAWHPLAFGIEDQAGVSAAARGNAKRALAAAAAGRSMKGMGFNASNDNVTGAVFIAKTTCMAYGADYELFQPRTIKIAVCGKGGGKAEKAEVIAAVRRMFPALAHVNLSEHVADAIAAAVHMIRVLTVGVISR